jgi:hypothetical protein
MADEYQRALAGLSELRVRAAAAAAAAAETTTSTTSTTG